ncbi:hypothetical protein HYR54_07310 [Candidatus Acetothermia bacterium]|nr:hypothetical protein [Candidatus Acetothermia bacterium]
MMRQPQTFAWVCSLAILLGLGLGALASPASLTITSYANLVRFTAEGSVDALQVSIFSLAGQALFDSGAQKAVTFDWQMLDAKDRPIANGVYLYAVTVTDASGKVSKHFGKLAVMRGPEQSALLLITKTGTIGQIAITKPSWINGGCKNPCNDQNNGDVTIATSAGIAWAKFDSIHKRLGIGTTTPAQLLHVAGNVQIDGDLICPNACVHSSDIANGEVSQADLAANSVDSSKVVDGSLGSADVNSAQIQVRVNGACSAENAIRSINSDGTVVCETVGGASHFTACNGICLVHPNTGLKYDSGDRDPATWFQAVSTCASVGARLPSADELVYLNIVGLENHWTRDLSSVQSAYTVISQTIATSPLANSNPYRCVAGP